MSFTYRMGTKNDLPELKALAIQSWSAFQAALSTDHWEQLKTNLHDDDTYLHLTDTATTIVCVNGRNEIIGMAFLVPRGNPTEIYDKDWCYIRFVSVAPAYAGQGIGSELTRQCISMAKANNETIIALHTSELMQNAIHLYQSLGFTVLKEIDRRLGKRYWLYTLHL
jgi:ribosomal protein S18 acetylase RimI-like enzyme